MKGFKVTEASSRGIVLVTTLTILLVLTMLALSAVQGTSLQELIIRNTKDSNLAFNAAEAAVKEAERGIDALTAISYEPDAAFVIHDAITLGALDVSSDEVWATAASISTLEDGSSAIDTVATQPKYLVQHVGTIVSDEDRLNLNNIGQDPSICCTQVFKVTARGTGGSDNAVVMIETTFGKRF